MMTTSADSLAAVDPFAPIAMPTSAAASTGASLTPSPTMMTGLALMTCDGHDLVGRQQVGSDVVDAQLRRHVLGGGCRVAGEHQRAVDAQRGEVRESRDGIRADAIAQDDGSREHAVNRHIDGELPIRQRGVDNAGGVFGDERVLPTTTTRPAIVAVTPFVAISRRVVGRGEPHTGLARTRDQRPGQHVRGILFRRGHHTEQLVLGDARRPAAPH